MATITSEQAKAISDCQRAEGRLQLANILGWEEFDEEDEPFKGLHLDFLYDNLMYCAQKGFPWPHVCSFFSLASDMVQDSKGKTLPDAVRLYKEKCKDCLSVVTPGNMNVFTDFFFTTFMQHYSLFQYVFTKEQDKLFTGLELPVHTPESPMPFSDAKDVTIWDYEQKLKDLETQAETRKAERAESLAHKKEEVTEKISQVEEKLKELDTPLERESLVGLIHEVACSHISAASLAIQSSIAETQDEVITMLDKTSIPRPSALGAPPRYKTKTPLGSIKHPKSGASKREKSSKSNKSRGSAVKK